MDAAIDSDKPTSTEGAQGPPPSFHRLSMRPINRIPIVTTLGFTTGLFLGISHGSKMTGMRFRAENAHRLPQTSTGWYLYHKSKNYHMMLGGLKEGMKMGAKVGIFVGAFFWVEEAVDQWNNRWEWRRGKKDALSSTIAGLTVAGAFSVWNRFPYIMAAQTAKLGLAGGLAFGLMQDALTLAKGGHVPYVDLLFGTTRRDMKLQKQDILINQ